MNGCLCIRGAENSQLLRLSVYACVGVGGSVGG